MIQKMDLQLIRGALEGSLLAGGQLTERYRAMVLGMAYQALNNADNARDVAQETLVYALVHLPELRDHRRFAAWLRNITLSQCADYRRRRGTRRLGEPIPLSSEASEEADYVERLVIRSAVAHLSEALCFCTTKEDGRSAKWPACSMSRSIPSAAA